MADLAEMRAELAALKSARIKILTQRAIVSMREGAAGGSAEVAYGQASIADLDNRIVRLEAEIAVAAGDRRAIRRPMYLT